MISRSLLILTMAALAAPVSQAGVPAKLRAANAVTSNSNPATLPPDSSPHGKTYDEWSVEWWQWFLPLTSAEVAACTIKQADLHVAFLLAGPESCQGTVKPGTSLFFPIVNVECSSLEAPPFHGATPAERETCAQGWRDLLATLPMTVEIDGKVVQNPTSYLAYSADFNFTVGPDNAFLIPCASSCTGQATGYGFYLMLAPLKKSLHTIHISVPDIGLDITWTLTVD